MGFRVAVAREQLTSNAGPNHFPKQAASLQGPESHSKWCLSRAQILTIDVQSRDRRRGGKSPCENSTVLSHLDDIQMTSSRPKPAYTHLNPGFREVR
jgi:hypothetical protein